MQPDLIARIEAAQPSEARASLIDELALAIDQFLTHQIERDTLACDLTPSELTELATGVAAIAAMRGEPVAWMQEHERGERVLSWKAMTRGAEELGWTETALYAGPTPPDSGKD